MINEWNNLDSLQNDSARNKTAISVKAFYCAVYVKKLSRKTFYSLGHFRVWEMENNWKWHSDHQIKDKVEWNFIFPFLSFLPWTQVAVHRSRVATFLRLRRLNQCATLKLELKQSKNQKSLLIKSQQPKWIRRPIRAGVMEVT